MLLGLCYAIVACLVWGLIFVVPFYLSDFSLVEVVLGRYFTYGILSGILFFSKGLKALRSYSTKAWKVAFTFALFSNLVYYLGLVTGLRCLSPTLTVMLVGMAPIGITFYGNFHAREMAFRDLAVPSLCIGIGLLLVHATEGGFSVHSTSAFQALLGFAGVVVALGAWVWYAVQNAKFLKQNTDIKSSEWATVIGVATLFWTVLIGGIMAIALPHEVNLPKFLNFSSDTLRYFTGASILGLLSSWIGCFLWSRASTRLPIVLMGPLLVFEVLFGLLFVYLYKAELPSWMEVVGIFSMIGGILMSLNSFRKKEAQ